MSSHMILKKLLVCSMLLFVITLLKSQDTLCSIDLNQQIDLKSFKANSLQLNEHYNIFNFYAELINCDSIDAFDYRVMHDANLLEIVSQKVYQSSVDSIVTYRDLLILFNLELKTEAFLSKKVEKLNQDKILSEIHPFYPLTERTLYYQFFESSHSMTVKYLKDKEEIHYTNYIVKQTEYSWGKPKTSYCRILNGNIVFLDLESKDEDVNIPKELTKGYKLLTYLVNVKQF